MMSLADCCFSSGIYLFTNAAAVELHSSAKARQNHKHQHYPVMMLFCKIDTYKYIFVYIVLLLGDITSFSMASVCVVRLMLDMVA